MICRNCGRSSSGEAKFCSECGTPFAPGGSGETTSMMPVTSGDTHIQELEADDQAVVESLPPNTALLIVRQGSGVGSRFLLDAEVTTVGRHPTSDIFLHDITVSRFHARFTRDADGIRVQDLGSLNGTYVNRTLVDRPVRLTMGDEVQVGKFRLVFYSGEHGLG